MMGVLQSHSWDKSRWNLWFAQDQRFFPSLRAVPPEVVRMPCSSPSRLKGVGTSLTPWNFAKSIFQVILVLHTPKKLGYRAVSARMDGYHFWLDSCSSGTHGQGTIQGSSLCAELQDQVHVRTCSSIKPFVIQTKASDDRLLVPHLPRPNIVPWRFLRRATPHSPLQTCTPHRPHLLTLLLVLL